MNTSTTDTPARKLTRITADFTPEAYDTLTDVANMLDKSKAEAMRQALGVLSFLLKEKKAGWRLYLEKGDDRKEIVTL
jgi:hypothetical protein